MGIGVSLFLVTIGAVLTFAVTAQPTGIDIQMVGVILMAVGAGVFLYTLIWWSDAMPWRHDDTYLHERYASPPAVDHDESVMRERRVISYERRAS